MGSSSRFYLTACPLSMAIAMILISSGDCPLREYNGFMKYFCGFKSTSYEEVAVLKCANADVYYEKNDGYLHGSRISRPCPASSFYQSCGLVPLEDQKSTFLDDHESDKNQESEYICGVLCKRPLFDYFQLKDPFEFCRHKSEQFKKGFCVYDTNKLRQVEGICERKMEGKICDGYCDYFGPFAGEWAIGCEDERMCNNRVYGIFCPHFRAQGVRARNFVNGYDYGFCFKGRRSLF